MTDYLTTADVLANHELIERYGGIHGVRDEGLLQSAVFRPQSGYYPDLVAEAAALWESLTRNHAFLDGNKRVGLAATYSFLLINGIEVVADQLETYAFINDLFVAGRFHFTKLESWLRGHVTPIGASH